MHNLQLLLTTDEEAAASIRMVFYLFSAQKRIFTKFLYASNNDSLGKDAPSLNALATRNFKCQLDSRFFAPIYKVKMGSVKKKTLISRCTLF